MCSSVPKVLHTIGGKPLLEHVIQTAQSLQPEKIHVVYGESGDLLRESLHQYDINWVEQTEQLGTGHAVMQVLPFIKSSAQVLILYGDVPLITPDTLHKFLGSMPMNGLSMLTAEFSEPAGFGRIVRDDVGNIRAVVEHKDASQVQRQIREINSGVLVTTAEILSNYLPSLRQNNIQGEYYLTDIIALLRADEIQINHLLVEDQTEVKGVNDQKQRVELERCYQRKIADNLLKRGVILMDPARFDLRGDLIIGNDVTIDINVVLEGKVTIGDGTIIGPNSFLKDMVVGKNVTIKSNCVVDGAVIGDDCVIGPFARIRPGTHLDNGAHVGNFVEIKNSKIGKSSKANHLSYIGDAVVGNSVNIGAGTITCNYDGVKKHRTIIEDCAFIGSNTALVAPVTIGKNAVVGAGSVITTDVPEDGLAVARARQTTIEGWKRNNITTK